MTRPAPTFETLQLSVHGSWGQLRLNRPDKLNAITPRMLDELIAAARWLDEDDAIGVVLLSGNGRAFCAGFDLGVFAAGASPSHDEVDLGRRMAEQLSQMRALTIAAIQGACVGGGMVIASACDLRVAAEDARFAIPEVDLGIPLGWGGIPRLLRELGPALTRELVLDCRVMTAAEAHAQRFVNRCTPAAALEETAQAWAVQLAAKAPYLLHTTKQQINQAWPLGDSRFDADRLLAAWSDPACRTMAHRYLEARRRP